LFRENNRLKKALPTTSELMADPHCIHGLLQHIKSELGAEFWMDDISRPHKDILLISPRHIFFVGL
jgi:hypothetical protein